MLVFLDILLTVVHIALIVFNLTGWIWKKTRRWHLITLILTAASWGVLGIWYGWGYCPLTDWHWDIKEKLGEGNLPSSFVKYLLDKIFNTSFSATWVDRLTLGCLSGAVIASIWVNLLQPLLFKKRK